ncbi:MAG: hypothetical protein AAB947_01120 [Patescibacteria group bacterium]|mgnify:CR=1 FL=1
MKTSQKILDYIDKNTQASGKELADYLGDITLRAVRKQLKTLLETGKLRKVGHPPKVFYLTAHDEEEYPVKIGMPIIDDSIRHTIDERYLFVTPDGEMKSGWAGFVAWSGRTKQDPVKTAREYIATIRKYDAFIKDGLIDGMEKMQNTFRHKVLLDRIFYLDFYSIERFGKTKIGQIILHAKNSQDKRLMKILADEVRPKVAMLIDKYSIDGVLFIPPTIRREVQFMNELKNNLKLPIRTVSVTKVKTRIAVAQKTLSKLEDRVENAKKTIVIEDSGTYKNILLIDDAVGSGSTLNETAAQIKKRGLCKGKIIGLAIVGSFKGFDVISEV